MTENKSSNSTPPDAKRSAGPFIAGLLVGIIIGIAAGYPLGGLLPVARATLECSDATGRFIAIVSQQLDVGDVPDVIRELRALRDHDFTLHDPAQLTMVLEASMDRLLEPD